MKINECQEGKKCKEQLQYNEKEWNTEFWPPPVLWTHATRTKILTHVFFSPTPKFYGLHDQRQNVSHATHELVPTTHPRYLRHLGCLADLKSVSHLLKKFIFICFNESPLKMIKMLISS